MLVRCLTVLLALSVGGLIDPRFTPIQLVAESQAIQWAVLKPTADPDQWTLQPGDALKGDRLPDATLSLASARKEQLEDLRKIFVANGGARALLFVGSPQAGGRAYLHIDGHWLEVKSAAPARWDVQAINARLSGVFAGGTDMLGRLVAYVLADDRPAVPVAAGVKWLDYVEAGRANGAVSGLAAVELKSDRTMYLFVAGPAGDRLYRADGLKLADVTGAVRLDTRSRRFCWINLNADGLPDLVTWDGQTITLRLLRPDGSFAPSDPDRSFRFDGPCLALSPLSVKGAPVVLVSSDRSFLLDAQCHRADLSDGPILQENAREHSACIVADLDNDGFCDVLQPRVAGGVLWKGSADGFAPPARSAVVADASACAAVGDFDTDGFLDIYLSGSREARLWENDGHASFKDVTARAGSLSYKNPPGASACLGTDLNHDGRPDLLVGYPNQDILYHFNRGFRCLGEEGEVHLTGDDGLPALDKPGLAACAAADFNGDAALDLAVAFTDGRVFVYYNDLPDAAAVFIRAAKATPGPITVSAWQGSRTPQCLGAWSVTGHTPVSLLPLRRAGACMLRCALPGRPSAERAVSSEDAQHDVILPARAP